MDNGFFKSINNIKTIKEVTIVNINAVEQTFFLNFSSCLSKNVLYIASYIPIIANALANDIIVFDISLIPKYEEFGINLVTIGNIINGIILLITPPMPYTIKFSINNLNFFTFTP